MIAPIRSRGQRPAPGTWRNAIAELRRNGDNRTVFGGSNLPLRIGPQLAGAVISAVVGRNLTHETGPA